MTDPAASDTEPESTPEGRFIGAVQPLPPWANVVLPRFGETTSEDLMAEAASQGRTQALNRCQGRYPAFNLHILSNTTDDIRFTAGESASTDPLEVTQFAADLTRIFGCPVRPQPLTDDLDPQWSQFDQFIVQLNGESSWRITEPNDLSALPGFSDPQPSTVEVWSGTIPAGTAMIVPRGWGYEAQGLAGQDDACISFVLLRWTGLDLIAELAQPAANWPLLRASAPVDIAAATESYDGDVYRENTFAELLAEIATLEQVDSCLARLQARVVFPSNPLAAPVGSETVFTLNAPTGVFWVVTEEADNPEEADTVLVAFSGLMMSITAEALPAFADLANGEPTRVVDLPLTGSAGGSHALVNELAERGLISPV